MQNSPNESHLMEETTLISNNLRNLLSTIQERLGYEHSRGLEELNVEELEQMINLVKTSAITPQDWQPFAFSIPEKYTRNLIERGINDSFDLLILCWPPGTSSTIHNHSGSHCIMRVLEGDLIETRFRMIDDQAMEEGESQLCKGEAAYIHDTIALHRITNRSKDSRAISLHLYTPAIQACKTFCEQTRKLTPLLEPTLFHSIRGKPTGK